MQTPTPSVHETHLTGFTRMFRGITYVITSYPLHSLWRGLYNDHRNLADEDTNRLRGHEWQKPELKPSFVDSRFPILLLLAYSHWSKLKETISNVENSLFRCRRLRNSAPQIAHCGLFQNILKVRNGFQLTHRRWHDRLSGAPWGKTEPKSLRTMPNPHHDPEAFFGHCQIPILTPSNS